jgi:SAM-dependent methyltransferase
MYSLPFQSCSFDLIWSEGSIYIIGFEKGLREWKRLLAPRGYVVITHVAWLKPNPPQEILEYWQSNYPQIRSIKENIESARKFGCRVIRHFVLPEKSWWKNYYEPTEAKLTLLKSKYQDDMEALNYLALEEKEIDMFRKYSSYYGYVFFVLQTEE